MADEAPSLTRLIKLIGMASSSNDHEALMALRKANLEADKFGGWQKLLTERITVIGDPFVDLSPPRTTTRAPSPMHPTPPPTPKPNFGQPARATRTRPPRSNPPPDPANYWATIDSHPTPNVGYGRQTTPATSKQLDYIKALFKQANLSPAEIGHIFPWTSPFLTLDKAIESLNLNQASDTITKLKAIRLAQRNTLQAHGNPADNQTLDI